MSSLLIGYGPLIGEDSDFTTADLILSLFKYFRHIFHLCLSFYPHSIFDLPTAIFFNEKYTKAEKQDPICLTVFCTSLRIRNQLLQALADIKSEALEEMRNKTLSEISEKLLNLRFRNFTNINGENEYIEKQRKEKRRLPLFYRKCKKETVEDIEHARPRKRREKEAKDGKRKEAKEKIRKKLMLHNKAMRKKSIDKRHKKIVVTLQYIISAVE